jgi:hypothetical protein
MGRLTEHSHITWCDNFSAVYCVTETSAHGSYGDDVIGPNLAQRAEELIAVSSDSHVP